MDDVSLEERTRFQRRRGGTETHVRFTHGRDVGYGCELVGVSKAGELDLNSCVGGGVEMAGVSDAPRAGCLRVGPGLDHCVGGGVGDVSCEGVSGTMDSSGGVKSGSVPAKSVRSNSS